MKRYILDEVGTYEEATKACGTTMAYFIHEDGEIMQTAHRTRKFGKYAKLTVLEGSPEQIQEAMMVMALGVEAASIVVREFVNCTRCGKRKPIDEFHQVICNDCMAELDEKDEREEVGDTLANLGLSEADFL